MTRQASLAFGLASMGFCVVTASSVAFSTISVQRVAYVGQTPSGGDGSAITTLNSPFTNSLGRVGFTGNLASGNNFVWHDADIIWLNTDGLPTVLTGTETTSGISDAGGFIYSPMADGEDAVWTHNGLLLRGTDPMPGLPGLFATFNSRPTMLPDGTAHWIAGFSNVAGGSTQGRVMYRCANTALPATSIPALKSGDTVGGFTIGASGIGFAYDFSDSGAHHIQELVMSGVPTASDTFIYVDGVLVAREGSPTGQGANWSGFDGVSINNSGNYVFGGDDSGATASDAFIAYDGNIIVKEGQTLDGYTLISGSAPRWTSINNLNNVAHIWESGSGSSLAGALFIGNASDLNISSRKLLQIGDAVDVNADGIADATVLDFKASSGIAPGISLSDDDFVHVEVDLTDIATLAEYEAILRVRVPGPCPADIAGGFNGGGNDQVNIDDLLAVISAWGVCADPNDCPADIAPIGLPPGDDEVNIDDLLLVISSWGACP
jgi:hypothetical protein